jgi:thymidylate kinase
MDGRACPAPDLVLILDAPGSLMHERKGEYTPETLEDWRQRFLGLQHRLRNVEVLDTSQPPDAVRTEAIDRIWRRYAERWGRR